MPLTVAQALAAYANNPNIAPIAVADTAADVGGTALDQLQVLTSHGKLASITVTDTTGPNGRVAASVAQLTSDAATLALISGTFRLAILGTHTGFYIGSFLPANCNDVYFADSYQAYLTGNDLFDTVVITQGPDQFNQDTTYFVAGSGGCYCVMNNIEERFGVNQFFGGAGGGANGPGNTLYANGGNNHVRGGIGSPSDVLVVTGTGVNSVFGGSGNNYIVGGTGKNLLQGGGGALQTLYGNSASGDYIVGGTNAGASDVIVELGIGPAQLWGAANGNDYIAGGAGDDLIVGGGLTNYLFGGAGDDTIYGGAATNYIYGGPGNDFIWTNPVGVQSTGYIYEGLGAGVDTVADFTPGNGAGHDVLVISGGTAITSFADVQSKAVQAGVYTVLSLSATDQVYLYNVQPFQLTANDFIFS